MSTESEPGEVIGGNAKASLESYARRIMAQLDTISEAQEAVKTAKGEAKSDGFDLKALGQCIKEMRKGPKQQAAQLELELVLDTYREALGLPTDLETAQKLAAQEAEQVPDMEARKASRRPAANDDDSDGDDDGGGKHKRKRAERKDLN